MSHNRITCHMTEYQVALIYYRSHDSKQTVRTTREETWRNMCVNVEPVMLVTCILLFFNSAGVNYIFKYNFKLLFFSLDDDYNSKLYLREISINTFCINIMY